MTAIRQIRNRRPGEPMSDDERRAMFARLGGGGGGGWYGGGSGGPSGGGSSGASGSGGSRTPSGPSQIGGAPNFLNTLGALGLSDPYGFNNMPVQYPVRETREPTYNPNPEGTPYEYNTEKPAWLRSLVGATKGFGEGLKGAASIITDKLSFGVSDLTGLTDSSKYSGSDYTPARWGGNVASGALTLAGGTALFSRAAAGYGASRLGMSAAGKVIAKVAQPALALGGFEAKNKLEEIREANPTMNPYADKALGMASDLAGYIGAMGAVNSIIGIGGGVLSKIPVSKKLSAKTLDLLKKAFTNAAHDPTGKRALGALTKSGNLSLLGVGKTALAGLDKAVKTVAGGAGKGIGIATEKIIGKKGKDAILKALKTAYKDYTDFSGFTGSTIKEGLAIKNVPAKSLKAKSLLKKATEIENQKIAMQAAEGFKAATWKKRVTKHLADAQAKIAAGDLSGAQTSYTRATDAFNKAEAITKAATKQTAAFAKDISRLKSQAANLQKSAKEILPKAKYVAGMMTGTTAIEELGVGPGGSWSDFVGMGKGIKQYEKEARAAFEAGKSFTPPADNPRGWSTLLATTVGIMGNPLEKLTRSGWAKEQASVGAYRAAYDMIQDAHKAGTITTQKRDAELQKLAAKKPFRSQGRGVWDVGSAIGTYLNWKVGEQQAKARQGEISRRTPGSYIDGDTLVAERTGERLETAKREEAALRARAQKEGWTQSQLNKQLKTVWEPSIRLLDMNAPEVAHAGHNDPQHPERTTGEPFGDKAAKFADKLIREGQYLRLIKDSHPTAQGETYGRDIRTVETLPKPFDQLMRLPVIGKYIPGKEFQNELIKAGLADIDYRELTKYKGDNLKKHDESRIEAQKAQRGIWSPEAQRAFADFAETNKAYTPWVGTESTMDERRAKLAAKKGEPAPAKDALAPLQTKLGSGLMFTGNLRAFSPMPSAGPGIAQTWNAILAILGARDYNVRAKTSRPWPISRPNIPTVGMQQIDALMRAREEERRQQALSLQ